MGDSDCEPPVLRVGSLVSLSRGRPTPLLTGGEMAGEGGRGEIRVGEGGL